MKGVRVRWIPATVLLLPVIEILVIIGVGGWLGWPVTLASLLALSVIGVVMVRVVGRAAFAELTRDRTAGEQPGRDVADRAMVFLGGMMLIPPGFVTDIAALVLLLPFTRPLIRRRVQRWAVRSGAMTIPYGPRSGGSRHGSTTPHGPDVVHGEVIDDP